jgi:hypothetical protein
MNDLTEWRKRIFDQEEFSLGDVPVEINGKPYVAKNVRMLPPEIGPVSSDDVQTFTIEFEAFQEGS